MSHFKSIIIFIFMHYYRVYSQINAKKQINSHFAFFGKLFPTIPSTWKIYFFFYFFRQNRHLRWRFALSTKTPHEVAVWSRQTAISSGGLVQVNRHFMWRFACGLIFFFSFILKY